MKTRLRILLPLCLLCTALFALSLCAAATAETGTCGKDLTYTFDIDTGALAVTGSGAMTDWGHVADVPWYENRAAVRSLSLPAGLTSVGARAFYGCNKLTDVRIPAGVERIGASAFADCTALASVTLPAGLSDIGDLAFFACGVSSITLPQGISRIGDAAFSGCKNLTRLDIPEGTLYVGDMMLSLCDSLGTVTVPETVKTVSTGMFAYSKGLQKITLPAGVETVEGLAFYGYENLKELRILNPQCAISDEEGTVPASATVYGYDGSTAETYAAAKGLQFVSLGEPPHEHTYADAFTVDLPATCASAGRESRHCTYPGCTAVTDTRSIPKDPDAHNFAADFTVDTPADCVHAGVKSRHCTLCGAKTDETVIPATGVHDYAADFTVDVSATCVGKGEKSRHCTVCDAKTDVTEIPATGKHTYGADNHCTVCGAEKPPYTPGDCNEDGEIDKRDLLRLQKYLADWDVEINMDAADCNGDGEVDKRDLLRLQKYLADWDVKLGE